MADARGWAEATLTTVIRKIAEVDEAAQQFGGAGLRIAKGAADFHDGDLAAVGAEIFQ